MFHETRDPTPSETETVTDARLPIVWIVNDAGHAYERAEAVVGPCQMRSLTKGDVNPLRVDRLNYHIAEALAKAATKEDYLLLCGHPVLNAMAASLWLLRFGQIRLLLWDAKKRTYERYSTGEDDLRNLLQRMMDG
jgi:hypothetical protein